VAGRSGRWPISPPSCMRCTMRSMRRCLRRTGSRTTGRSLPALPLRFPARCIAQHSAAQHSPAQHSGVQGAHAHAHTPTHTGAPTPPTHRRRTLARTLISADGRNAVTTGVSARSVAICGLDAANTRPIRSQYAANARPMRGQCAANTRPMRGQYMRSAGSYPRDPSAATVRFDAAEDRQSIPCRTQVLQHAHGRPDGRVPAGRLGRSNSRSVYPRP
jgi:hypothetical protein